MPPPFTKFHGLGNDYLVIESEQLAGIDDLGEFARICNRHYGAGGVAIVGKSDDDTADFTCRIFNPDGSEAGLSGNGTRCAVAYLHYNNLWNKDELRLSTRTDSSVTSCADDPLPANTCSNQSWANQSSIANRSRWRSTHRWKSRQLPVSIVSDHRDADGQSKLLHFH